jgi:DNA replication protein DnaC
MERLSNIMRTTQQRPPMSTGEHLPSQRPAQEQPRPPMRRPPTEQNGRLEPNTRPPYQQARSPLPPRPAQAQRGTWERHVPPAPRPVERPPVYGSQVPQYTERPPLGDYYEEEATPAYPTDWSDDTASMGYGDWENAPGYQFTSSSYVEENAFSAQTARPRDAHLTSRVPTPQSLGRTTQRLDRLQERNEPFVTRELPHIMPENMPRTPSSRNQYADRQVPAATAQVTPARPGPRPTQRTTQPLRSQQIARIPLEMQQQTLHPQHPQQPMLPETARSADYTIVVGSVNNTCPVCKGTGFLRNNVPFEHPQFGKAVACECKLQERKRKRRQQLQEISNLGAFINKRFATFDPRLPGLREAFEESAAFAKNPSGWLLLVGPNGCGKTHLAAAIANECLEAGAVVLFATVPDLLDHLRAAFAPDASEIYDQLFARMREAEVLILDDLGVQQSSPWANEKLFQLLNYRYNSGFPTVVTSNPRGFQATDERIRSRLSDVGLVITLNLDRARDYRPNNPRHP